MIKILHSADWHLDAPLVSTTGEQARMVQEALKKLPGLICNLATSQGCDLMLLSGDLFDGVPSAATVKSVKKALEDVKIPVCISPGNHDFVGNDTPWRTTLWPDNVHIFTKPEIEFIDFPQLNCRVYGAGFTSMDCPGLLENFRAEDTPIFRVGVFHADPTQVSSPYCPITVSQVSACNLQYLALGHIHKQGSFRAGDTLCAWPGCPVGKGYDEQGQKGALLVTVDTQVTTEFIPLPGPQFFDFTLPAEQGLESVLPPVGNDHFYRITLTGESQPLDLSVLKNAYPQFPQLTLRDETIPPVDIWSAVGQDNFEGLLFDTFQNALSQTGDNTITLAARICRQLLDGQEVRLP